MFFKSDRQRKAVMVKLKDKGRLGYLGEAKAQDIMSQMETQAEAKEEVVSKRPPLLREALSKKDVNVGDKITLTHEDSGKPYKIIVTDRYIDHGRLTYDFRHEGWIPALATTGSYSHKL
ncbi:hypothetical protein GQ472_00625 [archaeon]|nr:hypothetical protein [archaeon]